MPQIKRPDRRNRGFALLEAVVAGTLLLLLLQVAWLVTAVQSAAANRVVGEATILDQTRLVRQVLAAEVGHGLEQTDWSVDGGVLELRAFRGIGFRCRGQPSAGWGVAVSGYRTPDPDKDSVLVFSEAGGWQLASLVRRARDGSLDCHDIPGFSIEVWTLDPPHPDAVAGVYFERGAYRFSDGAFRYRVGNGGWQPLTSTGIATDSTSLTMAGADGLAVRVFWEDAVVPPQAFSWTVWGAR